MDEDLQQQKYQQSFLLHLNESNSLNETCKTFQDLSKNKMEKQLSNVSDHMKQKINWNTSIIEQKRGDGLSDQDLQLHLDMDSVIDHTNIELNNHLKSHITVENSTHINKQSQYQETPKQSDLAIESDFKKFRDAQKKKTYLQGQNTSQFDKGDQNDQEEGEGGQMGLMQFLRQRQETLNKQYVLFLRTLNIKKFMNIMKRKSRTLLFKYMTLSHFNIIGDNASDYDFFRFNNYLYYKVICIKLNNYIIVT